MNCKMNDWTKNNELTYMKENNWQHKKFDEIFKTSFFLYIVVW